MTKRSGRFIRVATAFTLLCAAQHQQAYWAPFPSDIIMFYLVSYVIGDVISSPEDVFLHKSIKHDIWDAIKLHLYS